MIEMKGTTYLCDIEIDTTNNMYNIVGPVDIFHEINKAFRKMINTPVKRKKYYRDKRNFFTGKTIIEANTKKIRSILRK